MSTNNSWGQPAWPAAAPAYPYATGYPYPAPVLVAARPPVSPFAWLAMLGGLVVFICSFLPYYTVKVTLTFSDLSLPMSIEANAWYGYLGWLGAALLLLAAIVIVIAVATQLAASTAPLAALIVTVAGLGCVIAAGLVVPVNNDVTTLLPDFPDLGVPGVTLSIETGHAVGYWVSLVCAVLTVAGALLFYLAARKAAPAGMAAPAYPQPQPGYAAAPGYAAPTAYATPSGYATPAYTPAPAYAAPASSATPAPASFATVVPTGSATPAPPAYEAPATGPGYATPAYTPPANTYPDAGATPYGL